MGLLAVLKGDTLHFNKNAVPVVNSIFEKLDSLDESEEKENLLKMLVISNTGIEALFHPDTGVIGGKVKKFDQEAFYILYEMTVLFMILNFRKVSVKNAEKLRKIFTKTIGRSTECDVLWNEMSEFTKNSDGSFTYVVQKISSYTGELEEKERDALNSAFLALLATFIDSV